MRESTSGPRGWSVARLEHLFETITDGDHQAPPQVEDGIPFLVIGNVRTSRLDFTDVRFVPEAYYQSLAEHRKPARGDLLYTVTGSLGIPALVDTDRAFCVQRHIAMLKPARETNVRYLFHALASTAAFQQATKAATGTAQKTLGLASLRAITVHVAPAEEQVRVVDALESYLSRLDAAVATLEAAQTKLKAYRASVLKAAVEGGLVPTEAALARAEKRDFEPAEVLLQRIVAERRRRWEEAELAKLSAAGKTPRDDNWKAKYEEPEPPEAKDLPELPEGWCWTNVNMVAEVKGGVTKGQRRGQDQELVEVPYLRVANVQRGYLDLAEMKTIAVTPAEVDELRLEAGDVLFNEGGDRDKLGRGWVWGGEIATCIHQNHVFRARIVSQDLRPRFLSWYGNSSGQRYFFDEGKQTTNLASINMTKLKALPVPLPPLAEQDRIAGEVERLLSIADEMDAAVAHDVRRCQRLRQAVLKWAFEGKLVDQDPSDEPAEKLLERIRAAHTNAETRTRARRTGTAR